MQGLTRSPAIITQVSWPMGGESKEQKSAAVRHYNMRWVRREETDYNAETHQKSSVIMQVS